MIPVFPRPSRHLLRSVLDALFPPRCVLCGAEAVSPAAGPLPPALCRACHAAVPRPGPCCPRCALPTPAGQTCGSCLRAPPPFDATLAACRYAFPIDRLLQGLKYQHRLSMAAPLAQLFLDAHEAALSAALSSVSPTASSVLSAAPSIIAPTCLIAMPLSASRQQERGFNQAQEIARPVAAALNLPLHSNALHRIRDTPQQTALPWDARHKNVRDAFRCDTSLAGQSVALFDDVMTTGATAAAAARALRHAGAAHVSLWVVARAIADEAALPF